ncbi:ribonuclease T2-like [Rhinoraja longicauda]
MGLPFLLLLFLVAASCSGKSNLEVPPDNILALQWPKNVCKVNHWTGKGCEFEWWTIHGWWPPKGGNVNMDPYNYNKIKSLQPDLDKVWPELSGKDTLWSHEWEAHGKPATQTLTVREYFEKGLNYYRRVESCANVIPKKAEACFRKLSIVKDCIIIRKESSGKRIITEARLYLK